MKLRWHATCDEDGFKTEATLQYYDDETCGWEEIPYVEDKLKKKKQTRQRKSRK